MQRKPGPLDTIGDDDLDEQLAVNFRTHRPAITAEAAAALDDWSNSRYR